MSTPARKRLMRDFKRLKDEPPPGINGSPNPDNIMKWNAIIFGPEDTPWDGGTFKLTLEFTEEYPNKAPVVRFTSTMFHPNIYADGSICLDILQNQWSPIYDVSAILTSIQSLLCDPNPNSPANSEAARLYGDNRREYNKRVREVVELSWTEADDEAEDEEEDEDDDEEEEQEEKGGAAAAAGAGPEGSTEPDASKAGAGSSKAQQPAAAAPVPAAATAGNGC